MKFTIRNDVFSEAVKAAGGALSAREEIDVFHFLHIRADEDGKVRITGQNGTYLSEREVEAEDVEESGEALVEGSKLRKMAAMLPAAKVSVSARKESARIRCGGSQSTLLCREEADPLRHSDVEEGTEISVDGDAFADALRRMRYARETGNAALWMTGAQVIAGKNGMLFVTCTDGFRLGTCRLSCNAEADVTIVIPGDAVEAVCGLCEGENTRMLLRTDGKRLMCRTGKGKVSTLLLAGEWPDWKRFFPLPNQIALRVRTDAACLKKAAERAEVIGGSSKLVKVRFCENTISITSKSAAGDYEENMEAEFERGNGNAGEMETALNVKYLLQALSSIGGGETDIELTGPLAPIVFSPREAKQEKHLILPVHVTEG